MFKKTVDGALRTFNKALLDLQVVIRQKEEEVVEWDDVIEEANREKADALKERERAEKVISKLEDLLSI